jgi:hypothetical protein
MFFNSFILSEKRDLTSKGELFSKYDGFGGLVVSMLASGTQVRWFTGVKILSMPPSGG